jgi:hypothetical protein
LINGLLQQPVNMIFCFRAKEKIKLVKRNGKTEPVELGWQAIAGEEFVYEMTDRFLLTPGCQGRPPSIRRRGRRACRRCPTNTASSSRRRRAAGRGDRREAGAVGAGQAGPLGDDVLQAFAGIHVTPAQIAVHLGREPNAHDTKALKTWYRDLKSGKAKAPAAPERQPPLKPSSSFLDDADDPSAGADVIVFTPEQVEKNIRAADTTDILDLARDQITGVQDEAARLRLTELADARDAELRETA